MITESAPSARDPLEQLRSLSETGRALTYATTLEQVARLTVERGAQLLNASSALIMLADDDGLLQVRDTLGIDESRVTRFRAPLDDELIGRLQGLLGVPDDCFVAVPLVANSVVTGLLAVGRQEPPSDADEWLLSALADQAAMALENARVGGEVRGVMAARLLASEGATNAKDRALATLAHDIRSPLGAIEAYCELLQDGVYGAINERQRDAIGRVRMSGHHLLSVLNTVMDMARLNAGVVRVAAERVNLSDVVREAVEIMLPAAEARLQTLQPGRPVDVVVIGDHGHLRQVLVNLIGNAIKFTPKAGVIGVTTGLDPIDPAGWGVVRVTDTGPGITEAERAAIFEPFYRSEGTAQEPGIGMGGTLDVESEPGAGATFVVRLARTAVAAA
jgi:signal transduction histidine kinase